MCARDRNEESGRVPCIWATKIEAVDESLWAICTGANTVARWCRKCTGSLQCGDALMNERMVMAQWERRLLLSLRHAASWFAEGSSIPASCILSLSPVTLANNRVC